MTFIRSVVFAAALALAPSALGAVGPRAELVISNSLIAPDGFARDAVVVNGISPGPLIAGQKGDRFRLNVVDKLTNHSMLKTTSIHWHGFFQEGTNWADGPAFVNQCPIASGNSFLYDFQVPDQAGTFWYHSHLSTQYCDGLRGAMVVYDPFDFQRHLYDVDNEHTVITLADWYHVAARLGSRFPKSDATLINGRGRSNGTLTAELAVINIQHGKRYRFRLVSLSCNPNYVFKIDGHNMTIIEVDGVSSRPHAVDSIQIFAGQRYSFALHAKQPVDNYWIRANPNIGLTAGTFDGGVNSAILRYEGARHAEPTTTEARSVAPLVETDLHPLIPMEVPGLPYAGAVDKAINLAFDFNGTNFFVNNVTFIPPTVPVLLQILSGAQAAQDLLPSGSVYALPPYSSIEITMPALAPGSPHPLHLHGHTFAVVRSAGSTFYNYYDPIFRDVVNIGTPAAGDNVTIRFRTDNPGPWFLHCHIDFHLEVGFAVVMAEDVPRIKPANPVPEAWSELCPTYDKLAPGDL
uniref:laccase n=1 Tax=Trametes hirsuta TaxID=5327 RepID=A0A0A7M212_TRAHI|nr:laccase E [Trametes hirsuta]